MDSGAPFISGCAMQPLAQAVQNSESPPVSNKMHGLRAKARGIEQNNSGISRFKSMLMFANP